MPSDLKTVRVQLDNRLRMPIEPVSNEAHDAIIDALCIPNIERENAKKHHERGWEDMPEFLVMYGLTGSTDHDAVVDMPRGFAADLVDGLEHFGYQLEFDDQRSKPVMFRVGRKITLREHQGPASDAIYDNEQGIYKAPPGSGKTVAVLHAGKRASTRCLVIVNTKDILNQWVNRIHEHLGDYIHVGIIGDGKFDLSHTWTIATAQTIHARYEALDEAGFFDHFGFVCLDECHHATADTYLRIMDRFTACWRFGVSATPDKTGDFALAQLVLGPIIHTTKHTGLIEAGHLIKPEIIRVKTDFKFGFRTTTSRWSKSNYPQLVQALVEDRRRNKAIVGALMREQGHHCLVQTKRHDHIDILEAMLDAAGYKYPIMRLTGKEKSADRKAVISAIDQEPGCLFSTIADEALDIPRIDRGFLVFPQSNVGLVQQQVGRYERTHPDKKDSRIYDFADVHVGVLKSQWTKRRMGIYLPRGFTITKINMEELL